jgi:hypothetical protein
MKWGLKVGEVLEIIDKRTFYLDGMKTKAYSNSNKNIFYCDIIASEIGQYDKNIFKTDDEHDFEYYDLKYGWEALGITENHFKACKDKLKGNHIC